MQQVYLHIANDMVPAKDVPLGRNCVLHRRILQAVVDRYWFRVSSKSQAEILLLIDCKTFKSGL